MKKEENWCHHKTLIQKIIAKPDGTLLYCTSSFIHNKGEKIY